jgi:phosphoribosylglycinamide formyltransferase 1
MPDPIRIAAMASGGGTNLQAIIDACEAGSINGGVELVFSDRSDAGALERARKHGIETLHMRVPRSDTAEWEETDRRIAEVFKQRDVDLVVMAGYMRKIGPSLLATFRDRIMNIHPGLLPAFPGVEVQWDAVEYGVKIAGPTVHFASEEFDSGPIIIQAAVPVLEGDTGQALADRILAQEHRIYPQAVQWFAEGRLKIEGRGVKLVEPTNADETAAIISPPLDGEF